MTFAPLYQVIDLVGSSVWQSTLSTGLSLFFGLMTAFLLHRTQESLLTRFLTQGFGFFFAFPVMPLVLGVMVCFDALGRDPYGLSGIVVCHTLLNAPFIALFALQGWDNVPAHYIKLARVMDFSFFSRVRLLYFAPVMQGCVQGAVLVFFMCMTSFTTVLFLSQSTRFASVSLGLYHALILGDDPHQTRLLLGILFALSALKVCVVPFTRSAFFERGARRRTKDEKRPSSKGAVICLVLLMTAWCAPLVMGAIHALGASWSLFSPFVFKTILLSMGLGALCALASLVLGLFLSDMLTGRFKKTALFLLTPLMLPSFVMGIFLFFTLHKILDVDTYAPLLVWGLQTLVCTPFVARLLCGRLDLLKGDSRRLVQILHLSRSQQYRLIYLPQMGRLLRTAFSLAGAMSLGDLASVCLFGASLPTLSALISGRMDAFMIEDALLLSYVLGLLACLFFVLPYLLTVFRRKQYADL
jgi:thiamine transport system permease protein